MRGSVSSRGSRRSNDSDKNKIEHERKTQLKAIKQVGSKIHKESNYEFVGLDYEEGTDSFVPEDDESSVVEEIVE